MKRQIVLVGILLAVPFSAARAADGKALYDRSCRACHGPNGEGNIKIASMMKVEIRHLGSPEVQAKSDAALKKSSWRAWGK